MIRVVVADDHPIVREGLRRVLERAPGITVVADVDGGDRVAALTVETGADVVVLDISMPGPEFLRLIPAITQAAPRARVLVLSGHPEQVYAVPALRAGAAGYLNKVDAADRLVEAVRRIGAGHRYLSASLADQLARSLTQGDHGAPPHLKLSSRELEVLRHMARGLSQKEIGARLGVNPKTVSTYRARVLEKLDVGSNAEAVRYAVEHQLVDPIPFQPT